MYVTHLLLLNGTFLLTYNMSLTASRLYAAVALEIEEHGRETKIEGCE